MDTTIFNALERRASDIHIETRDQEVAIKYRIDGVLHYAMPPIAKEQHSTIISRIKVMSELDIAERRVPQDGRFRVRYKSRHRFPRLHHADDPRRGRRAPRARQGIDEREVPQALARRGGLRRRRPGQVPPLHQGAVRHGAGHRAHRLAARPPRSTPRSARSRTTKTRSSPSKIRSNTRFKGITQIPVNEKKGLTFARGLRSILRHDPDKIMVGEIRDQETAQIAINSALTGHLVFTTVHANNVLDVLGRFLNMGVEPYNFVSALNCILAQRLVRVICEHCRTGCTTRRTCWRKAA